jgi:hypothetical protein
MKLSIAVAMLMVGITCSCQPREDGVYAALPASDREALRAAVDELVALQVAGDWARIYDLLYDRRNLSKQEFVRQKHGNRLLRFVPEAAAFIPHEESWLITGCAAFESKQPAEGKGLFSSIYAHKVGNAWRLSQVAIVIVEDQHARTRPCTIK